MSSLNFEAMHRMFNDTDPWATELPRLHRMLAWPDGRTRRPPVPWMSTRGAKIPVSEHGRRTRYWAPLLHLAWWYFGWQDPAAAALNLAGSGLVGSSPGMRVIYKWWGESVVALALWEAETGRNLRRRNLPARSPGEIASMRDFLLHAVPPADLEAWRTLYAGGSDGLHLTLHASTPGEAPSEDPTATGLASFDEPYPLQPIEVLRDGSDRVVILLRSYASWCYWLEDVIRSSDIGPECSVDVVVLGIGWLGRFRRSPATGIWHAAQEWEHLFGAATPYAYAPTDHEVVKPW